MVNGRLNIIRLNQIFTFLRSLHRPYLKTSLGYGTSRNPPDSVGNFTRWGNPNRCLGANNPLKASDRLTLSIKILNDKIFPLPLT